MSEAVGMMQHYHFFWQSDEGAGLEGLLVSFPNLVQLFGSVLLLVTPQCVLGILVGSHYLGDSYCT